jgi:hypothetical protein
MLVSGTIVQSPEPERLHIEANIISLKYAK